MSSRSRRLRPMLVVTAALVVPLLAGGPASASDPGKGFNEDDQIVLTGRLVVASDETVDSAVILNGPATIEGTVRKDLFVLNGDTDISGTVRGDVVVVNGDLTVRSSAEIGGDLATQRSPVIEDGATIKGDQRNVAVKFDWSGLGLAGRFVWWLGYSVSVLILGLLLLALAPGLGEAVRVAVRERTGASIGWGFALFFLIPIAAVILAVTVLGTPLGIFVLLALALIYTIGYTAATVGAGSLFIGGTRSRYLVFLVGWAVLRVVALIPILGGLLWFLGSVWGLGLIAVTARGRAGSQRMTTPVPPPPPMPVAG